MYDNRGFFITFTIPLLMVPCPEHPVYGSMHENKAMFTFQGENSDVTVVPDRTRAQHPGAERAVRAPAVPAAAHTVAARLARPQDLQPSRVAGELTLPVTSIVMPPLC